MGTYEKQYSINWVNFNVKDMIMESEYSVKAILDGVDEAPLPNFRSKVEDQKYIDLFSIPATIWGQETTLGEFIGYMSACAAQIKDPAFPIDPAQTAKWGTQGIDLLNS